MKHFRLLQSKYLFTWQVFGLSVLWALFLHFADTATNQSTDYGIRAVILIATQLLMFGIIYILSQPFFYRIKPSSQPLALFCIIMIAATIRGAVLGLALKQYADMANYPIFNRAMTSLSNMTLQIVLTTIVLAAMRTHYSRKIHLLSESDHLATLTNAATGALSLMDERAAEPIRSELLAVVSALPVDNSLATRDILKATIDDVVRPLSHALDREPQWQPPEIPKSEIRFNWGDAISEAAVPKHISPAWILYGLTAGVLPNITYEVGVFKGFFFALHTAAFGFALFLLAKLLGTGVIALMKSDSARLKRSLFFSTLILSGVALGEYARLFLPGESGRTRFFLLAPVATLIIGTLVAILNSVFEQVEAIEGELQSNAENLTWTLAKTREIKRHAERTLANILHGKVQAAFAAAYLRVEMESETGRDITPVIATVKSNLTDFIETLDFGYAIPEELAVTVSRIRTTWLGVAEISFAVDSELENLINLDIFCLTTINDILPELCFNSINHGKAQQIDISITRLQHRTVEVLVSDNGPSDLLELRRGMGTRLLDECAMRWSRERIGGSTVIRIVLPFEDGSPAAPIN